MTIGSSPVNTIFEALCIVALESQAESHAKWGLIHNRRDKTRCNHGLSQDKIGTEAGLLRTTPDENQV